MSAAEPMPEAHPRWRGAHLKDIYSDVFLAGSSPLARGTSPQRLGCAPRIGLIPAGAGHMAYFSCASATQAAHPRWRGAHFIHVAADNIPPGSSPLARGTLSSPNGLAVFGRLIPAGAGHMISLGKKSHSTTAHPRWRGAHTAIPIPDTLQHGSSPLARGTYLMICIYSKTVLILHLTQNKRHGYSYLTYRYLRRRRAVAHPLRGLLLVVLLSGRIMRVMPSKSVGIQS